jgi:7-carboxy-7-deazaguanine synthase
MKIDTPVHELYPAIQAEGSRAGRPTIIIRTTGCTHRCFFGEGGWCDAWQSSIHPEKAKFTFLDIETIYNENPQIREMMLTGGSPTMHPKFVDEMTKFCHSRGIYLTMETEGSHFVKTTYPIDLISLSPKFSNSIPKLGIKTPMGKDVDQKFIDQHNKLRLNYEAIFQLLDYHKDYHYKPVWGGDAQTLGEIEEFRVICNIPKEKTFLMPAGDNRETLFETYKITMEKCIQMGYNWTGRPHIIAYDKQRFV